MTNQENPDDQKENTEETKPDLESDSTQGEGVKTLFEIQIEGETRAIVKRWRTTDVANKGPVAHTLQGTQDRPIRGDVQGRISSGAPSQSLLDWYQEGFDIPIEDSKGNSWILKGCRIKSVSYGEEVCGEEGHEEGCIKIRGATGEETFHGAATLLFEEEAEEGEAEAQTQEEAKEGRGVPFDAEVDDPQDCRINGGDAYAAQEDPQ